jgi:hypothetical protein
MGRRRKKRRDRQTRNTPRTSAVAQESNTRVEPPTAEWWRVFPRGGRGIAKWTIGVLGFLGTVAGVLSLQSHVSVAPGGSRPPTGDPLSYPFTVTNEGLDALKDVWSKCTVDYMEYYDAGRYYQHTTPGAYLPSDSAAFRVLGVGDAVSVTCSPYNWNVSPLSLLDSVEEVQITLRILYRPWPLPGWRIFTRHKDARFGARRYKDGSFQWEPDPLPSKVRDSLPSTVPEE